jgi:hypothetical protein
VSVSTPLAKVWPYLSDFTNTEDWDPPTVTTRRTSGDGGVGTTYLNVSKILGSEQEAHYRVVRRDEEALLELEGESGSVRLHDTITFAATPDGGTEVTYRAEFKPSGVGKLAAPLLPAPLKILGDQVAKTLADRLEKL